MARAYGLLKMKGSVKQEFVEPVQKYYRNEVTFLRLNAGYSLWEFMRHEEIRG
jgi:hypothetical protein